MKKINNNSTKYSALANRIVGRHGLPIYLGSLCLVAVSSQVALASGLSETGLNPYNLAAGSGGMPMVLAVSGPIASREAAENITLAAPAEAASSSGVAPVSNNSTFALKGVIITLPPPSGTIDQDLFGLRQKLEDDYGIGYFGYSLNTYTHNVLHAAHSLGGQQVYVGQRPTIVNTNALLAIFDLSRYGVPDGQAVISGMYQRVSWNPAGPNDFGFNQVSYYQTLFNKRVEIEFGLLPESFNFVGSFVGGSLAGGVFGTSGNLFTESGQNGQSDPTYAINIKGNITKYFYDKLGVGRAIAPSGPVIEHELNPIGVRFATKNSGLWMINEVGYLQPATADQDKIWVRGGTLLSEARYVELNHTTLRGNNNYAFYLLADKQLLHTSLDQNGAYRGLYVGFSAEYVPPTFNKFSQYYEARIYGLGLFPSRPYDQISLVANDFVFSHIAVNAARSLGESVHSGSQSITLSYSAKIYHGTYLNLGLGYTDNPTPITYQSNTGSDLNTILGLSVYF